MQNVRNLETMVPVSGQIKLQLVNVKFFFLDNPVHCFFLEQTNVLLLANFCLQPKVSYPFNLLGMLLSKRYEFHGWGN